MKMMIGAIALALAVPALAQQAPATDEHAQHEQGKHDCKECCEKMKEQHGKMECMDEKGEAKGSAGHADHQGHSEH